MKKLLKILKNLVYPVTLLTLISLYAIYVTIQSLIIAYTNDHTAAIYAAVVIPITLIILMFYVLDRVLIKKMAYYKIMLAEIAIALVIFLGYKFQTRTIDVNIQTDQIEVNFQNNPNEFLIVFDTNINSISKFEKKNGFGKQWNVRDSNIIHLDSTLATLKNLRINPPKTWESPNIDHGTIILEGKTVKYIYGSK